MEYKTEDLDNFRNLRFLDKYLVKTNGFVAGGCLTSLKLVWYNDFGLNHLV